MWACVKCARDARPACERCFASPKKGVFAVGSAAAELDRDKVGTGRRFSFLESRHATLLYRQTIGPFPYERNNQSCKLVLQS